MLGIDKCHVFTYSTNCHRICCGLKPVMYLRNFWRLIGTDREHDKKHEQAGHHCKHCWRVLREFAQRDAIPIASNQCHKQTRPTETHVTKFANTCK